MSGDHAKTRASTAPPPSSAAAHSAGRGALEAAAVDPAADGSLVEIPVETASPPNWTSWSNLWQVPSVVISIALIALGMYVSIKPPPSNDFDGAFAQIDTMIAAREFEPAAERLKTAIEPNLPLATVAQQARFHTTLANLVASTPLAQSGDVASNQQVCDEFAKAIELEAKLNPLQLEQWADSLLACGRLDDARLRLAELDELDNAITAPSADGHNAVDVNAIRNRVFRRVVERSLASPDFSYDHLQQLLVDYRLKGRVTPEDELWAIARQTEMRLQAGFAQQAVDSLLVEMRRLENAAGDSHVTGFGELYTLLAQAYYGLGDTQRAQTHLDHAMLQFHGSEPARGDALLLMGSIALSQGDTDTAYEKFHGVVRDFINTRSYLPGLLGRAEVHGMRGDHEASQADYRSLRELLPTNETRRDINRQVVAQSLCDRHDAAVAMNKLDRALEYAVLAEGFFPADQTPADVLLRIASTNRQIADNLIAQAAGDPAAHHEFTEPTIDPAIRHEANVRYERAGNYYLRRSSADLAGNGAEDWAGSLWMAADSFDHAGKQDRAIAEFMRYLETRPSEDKRRGEALYRIAQAHHALLEFDKAAPYYEQVIADRVRSNFAAQSYVPLAHCYLALDRRDDAIAQLRQVLSGDRLLKPDARDYRDALIALGRVHYDGKEYIPAIEQFSEAVQRYPNDPRRTEIMFMLADSYRGNAMALDSRLQQDTAMSPSEQGKLNSLRSEHLQMAQDFFAAIGELSQGHSGDHSDQHGDDLLRRARLYRADCVFHLGQYEQAIALYDQAARQYSAHQSSMYALIQIVNCYSALGDAERSAAAHQRAMVRLKQLPDESFAAPDALMDRSAWEKWLDNTPVGFQKTADAQAGPG